MANWNTLATEWEIGTINGASVRVVRRTSINDAAVFAIAYCSSTYNKKLQDWEYEPSPSNRTEDYLKDNRFNSLAEIEKTLDMIPDLKLYFKKQEIILAKTIKVEVDPGTGEFSVDLTGYQGKGCDDIIKAFAEVGTVTKEVHKAEFNAQNKQNTVKVGH